MTQATAARLALGWWLLAASALGAGELAFEDAVERWGLVFRHHHGGSGQKYMVETVVGGTVLFDYDEDGDVDALFVDGGPLPGYEGEPPSNRLFRNDGAGRFVDVTERAGVAVDAYGSGGTAGDVDGDRDLDLYLTAFGVNRLLLNDGRGGFAEAGPDAGVGDPAWSSSAAFSDVDRDGDLDLYVVDYVDFTIDTHKFCGDEEAGIRGYCHPDAYQGLGDRFYRNRGDGTFVDDTAGAGLAGAVGPGLGVVVGDVDGDAWPDVYVANDAKPNFLFRNRGDGTFEDYSLLSGTAFGDRSRPEGGMGVDLGDVDGDGLPDIVVTNFEFESNGLYLNNGATLFVDGRFRSRIAEDSIDKLAFGVALADLDNDADLDLVVANGHILDNADLFAEGSRYAQPNQLFENTGAGVFRLVTDSGLDRVAVSRGLAVGDLDGDGDLDLVIVSSNDLAEVWENVGAGGSDDGGWLLLDLRGEASNTFGIDAALAVVAGGRRQVRQVRTASSYLSQNPLTVHFGTGRAERVDALEVRWPSGRAQRFTALSTSRRYRLVE